MFDFNKIDWRTLLVVSAASGIGIYAVRKKILNFLQRKNSENAINSEEGRRALLLYAALFDSIMFIPSTDEEKVLEILSQTLDAEELIKEYFRIYRRDLLIDLKENLSVSEYETALNHLKNCSKALNVNISLPEQNLNTEKKPDAYSLIE